MSFKTDNYLYLEGVHIIKVKQQKNLNNLTSLLEHKLNDTN